MDMTAITEMLQPIIDTIQGIFDGTVDITTIIETIKTAISGIIGG